MRPRTWNAITARIAQLKEEISSIENGTFPTRTRSIVSKSINAVKKRYNRFKDNIANLTLTGQNAVYEVIAEVGNIRDDIKTISTSVKETINPTIKEPTECAVFSDVNLGIITHITEPLTGEEIRKLQVREAAMEIEGWHDTGESQIVFYKGQPTNVVAYDLEICRALRVGDCSGRPLELMLIRRQRMDEILLERHQGKVKPKAVVNSKIIADDIQTDIFVETVKGWIPFSKWWTTSKSNRRTK